MMPDPNFTNQKAQPKRKLRIAILLGLLTFVVTPVVEAIVGIPFLFFNQIPESFNPIVIIAGILGLRELSGFFAAHFILVGLLALLGNFATALISWFMYRSKKLAAVTFFSALLFQFVLAVIVIALVVKESEGITKSTSESEMAYLQFAKIGNVSFAMQGPYADAEIDNRHPEYGPLYKQLQIAVPIAVSQAGVYNLYVEYRFSKAGVRGRAPAKDMTETLGVGEHIVKVEFIADGSYGFWSPASVGGVAKINLTYLVSEKEMLEKTNSEMKSASAIEREVYKQFLKDTGLDTREVLTEPTINKFVERKEIHF